MIQRSVRAAATSDAVVHVTVAIAAGASANNESGRRIIHEAGPVDTETVIIDPPGMGVPAAGPCENTSPPGTTPEGSDTTLTAKPADRSSTSACATLAPITLGTVRREGNDPSGCTVGTVGDGTPPEIGTSLWCVAATLTTATSTSTIAAPTIPISPSKVATFWPLSGHFPCHFPCRPGDRCRPPGRGALSLR